MTEPTRPRVRGIWITIAVVTAFVIVVPAGVRIGARLFRQTRTGSAAYHHAIRALEIDAPGGTVTVGAGPAGDVEVRQKLFWAWSRPRVRRTWDGDTLRIHVTCARTDLVNKECGAALDLRVPADVAVDASVASGDIDVRHLSGDLRLRATAGAVRMVGVSGGVWARSVSGLVTGSALTSPNVDAGVTSGQVRLRFTGPPTTVTAAATSGAVSIGVPPGARYRVSGTTASGSRHVEPALVDAGSSRAITLTSVSGSATLGFPPPA